MFRVDRCASGGAVSQLGLQDHARDPVHQRRRLDPGAIVPQVKDGGDARTLAVGRAAGVPVLAVNQFRHYYFGDLFLLLFPALLVVFRPR